MFFCKNKFRHCGYHNLSCHWPHKFCEQHPTRPSRGAKPWSMAPETDLRFGEDRWSALHRFTGGKNMFWCQKFWRQISLPTVISSPWPAADWKPLDFLAPLDTSRGAARCSRGAAHTICTVNGDQGCGSHNVAASWDWSNILHRVLCDMLITLSLSPLSFNIVAEKFCIFSLEPAPSSMIFWSYKLKQERAL